MAEPRDPSNAVEASVFVRARVLFESALDWPPTDRPERLTKACAGDDQLRAVVERMLQADAAPHRLLDSSVPLSSERLRPGDTIAQHLRIIDLIGQGGMGEVYRAHDSSLGRDVAIKVLRSTGLATLETERERLARFKREAHILAALNHPNIAVIHAIEEWPTSEDNASSVIALVLELVEGPTLADRLKSGALPFAEVVRTARQIAEALEAAHAQGIVHRDLKPHNVKLRPDGVVKLLDFGLAKIAADRVVTAPAVETMTDMSHAQRTGMAGTPAYMSPEQARGDDADTRSDIWAFGAVLFEMLTGARAFPGADAASAIEAVLHRPIDWRALDRSTPSAIRTLLSRCLERDGRRRLRDIGEARIALEDLADAAPRNSAVETEPGTVLRNWISWAALSVAAVAGVSAVALWPRTTADVAVSRFTLATTAATALNVDPQSIDLALTPDGRQIVYKGGTSNEGTQLFVRGLDQIDPLPLTPPGLPKGPFSSADGRWIGFVEPGGQGPTLKKVAISGGPIVDVAQLDGASRGAAWADDGSVIVATASLATGLQRIPPNGGAAETLTTPARERGEADHLWPRLLPGGRSVLFTVTSISDGLAASQIAVLDLSSRTWKTVVRGGRQAQYLPSGHLTYVVGESLWVTAFDLATLETRGVARMIVPQIVTLPTGVAEYDVAQNGTLVYASGRVLPAQRTLSWVDRDGREEPFEGVASRPYASVRLSPDGTRVALEIDDEQNDIWVSDVTRKTLTRVTDDPGLDESAIWTHDGRLIFTSQGDGSLGSLFIAPADGSGTAKRLTRGTTVQRASAVLPDGSGVLFDEFANVVLMRIADGHQAPVLRTPQTEQSGVVSPDGRWLAYVERDKGAPQVFVRPFPQVDDAKFQISTGGGLQPVWARDGRELFFLGVSGELMGVKVANGPAPFSPERRLALGHRYFNGAGLTSPRTYDVAPDGRFLVIKSPSLAEDPAATVRMVVVLNWPAEVTRALSAR